jgi:hypothetical protein
VSIKINNLFTRSVFVISANNKYPAFILGRRHLVFAKTNCYPAPTAAAAAVWKFSFSPMEPSNQLESI